MEHITEAILIGLWALLYMDKLIKPGEIFAFMPGLVAYLVTFGKHNAMTLRQPNLIQNAFRQWGYRCEVCHAGIVSLVIYAIRYHGNWSPFDHFYFIVIAMFTAYVSGSIKERYL